jgi:hypothetical protein
MANGLLSPVELQTRDVFGMVPMEERLSLLPRYSKSQGLIAPQFIYELAKAVATPITAAKGYEVTPEEAINVAAAGMGGSSIGTAPKGALKSGLFRQGEFDPRFDPRKLEQERLRALTTVVNTTSSNQIPVVDLTQFAGRPFITSMSDRTAAGGKLTEIKGVKLDRPIGLLGGQDYMFYNPGQVWASGKNPVNQIMQNAQVIKEVTGQNPLYLPWRMAPSGGDFATMTGETMLSYANSALSKAEKTKVNKEIKKFIPKWSGLASDQSVEQFRNAPDSVRKALKNALDTNFRNAGGLSIGEARLAVADPRQLVGADAGIMNVGEIFANSPIIGVSGHPSYPRGVPGQGLGRLQENRTIFELLPQVVRERGIVDPTKPSQTDIRALMMKPYAGIIDDKLLKALGY